MVWAAIASAALPSLLGSGGGGGGGLSGLLGGGGTKVTQNVSQSSNSSLGLSFTNLVGAGQVDTKGVNLPVTQSPTATSTHSNPSPDPVYGMTYGSNYEAGSIGNDLEFEEPLEAGFNPLVLVALAAGGLFLFTQMKE